MKERKWIFRLASKGVLRPRIQHECNIRRRSERKDCLDVFSGEPIARLDVYQLIVTPPVENDEVGSRSDQARHDNSKMESIEQIKR